MLSQKFFFIIILLFIMVSVGGILYLFLKNSLEVEVITRIKRLNSSFENKLRASLDEIVRHFEKRIGEIEFKLENFEYTRKKKPMSQNKKNAYLKQTPQPDLFEWDTQNDSQSARTDQKIQDKTKPEIQSYDSPFEKSCLPLYNEAVRNPKAQDKFWDIYQPIRVGVVNAMARHKDPSVEPDFRDADGGDYYAVRTKDDNYTFFPRFDITIQDLNYIAGAMEKVFECVGYEPQYRYNVSEVVVEARVKRFGNSWEIQRKGKIKLEKLDE